MPQRTELVLVSEQWWPAAGCRLCLISHYIRHEEKRRKTMSGSSPMVADSFSFLAFIPHAPTRERDQFIKPIWKIEQREREEKRKKERSNKVWERSYQSISDEEKVIFVGCSNNITGAVTAVDVIAGAADLWRSGCSCCCDYDVISFGTFFLCAALCEMGCDCLSKACEFLSHLLDFRPAGRSIIVTGTNIIVHASIAQHVNAVTQSTDKTLIVVQTWTQHTHTHAQTHTQTHKHKHTQTESQIRRERTRKKTKRKRKKASDWLVTMTKSNKAWQAWSARERKAMTRQVDKIQEKKSRKGKGRKKAKRRRDEKTEKNSPAPPGPPAFRSCCGWEASAGWTRFERMK